MATSSPTDEANTHSLVPPPPLRVSVPVDVAADNDDDDEFPRSRPSPLALSPSALELVPEPDGSPDAALFEFSDEEEDGLDDAPVGMAGALSRLSAGPVPPMPPLHVLLFALAPSLRLGAFLLPYESTPLVKSIPVLLFFGGMSTLARQIWYMLARYVGTADVETVIANTFARAPRRIKARQLIRMGTRGITGVFRVLLATIYLREAIDAVLPHLPRHLLTSRIPLTATVALFVVPLAWAPSIAAKRIAITTWLSLILFLVWFSFAAVAHAKGLLSDVIPSEGRGRLWDDIPIIAFTFITVWDVPLYASLKAGSRPGPRAFQSAGSRRAHSFRIVSLLASVLSLALILPLLFFGPTADLPAAMLRDDRSVNAGMAVLSAVVLVLAIPPLVITTPSAPLPRRLRQSVFHFSRTLVIALILGLSLVPAGFAAALSDLTLLLALSGNYLVPAFLHIAIHQFKRPLSILVRGEPASTDPENDERAPLAGGADELLVRKERALQRARWVRRVAWDVAVWTMLLPVGGGGMVWAAGRLVGQW